MKACGFFVLNALNQLEDKALTNSIRMKIKLINLVFKQPFFGILLHNGDRLLHIADNVHVGADCIPLRNNHKPWHTARRFPA